MYENLIKIREKPEEMLSDPINLFGNWINDINSLRESYLMADPYPHVVIDNFLNKEFASKILDEFPDPFNKNWFHYINPIEYKYAMDKLEYMESNTKNLFYAYCHEQFVDLIKKITDIPNLEFDPFLHGAGLHYHPRGGRLSMHLDYSIHPLSKKERRVNIILFLNKNWEKEYNGDLEIWSNGMEKCIHKVQPVFNRAVLFRTSDESWHGLPEKIKCPENMGRKSIAIYYVSEPRVEATPRYKAQFVQRPTDEQDDKFRELAKLRMEKRITDEDLIKIYGTDYKNFI